MFYVIIIPSYQLSIKVKRQLKMSDYFCDMCGKFLQADKNLLVPFLVHGRRIVLLSKAAY